WLVEILEEYAHREPQHAEHERDHVGTHRCSPCQRDRPPGGDHGLVLDGDEGEEADQAEPEPLIEVVVVSDELEHRVVDVPAVTRDESDRMKGHRGDRARPDYGAP